MNDGATTMTEAAQQRPAHHKQLDEQQLALIAEIRANGDELQRLVNRVRDFVDSRPADPAAQPQRWASIGATDLQTGLMALIRAVAQPTTF